MATVLLTVVQVAALSAAFAVSNYGHEVRVPRYLSDDVRANVEGFAGHIMETHEHEEMFYGEAMSWYKRFKGKTLEAFKAEWCVGHITSYKWIDEILKWDIADA